MLLFRFIYNIYSSFERIIKVKNKNNDEVKYEIGTKKSGALKVCGRKMFCRVISRIRWSVTLVERN